MCEVDFNYKSKLERHLDTDKHAALAGITNITDAQVDDSPSVTSESPVIESGLKEVHSDELNLPELPSFLSAMKYTSGNNEQSTVVYVDIVSLPVDCKDTVLHVLNKLYRTFVVELSFHSLIVTCDAKTYDILQELRYQYGS